MENEFIKYFVSNGPFALLFVWLLFNTQKRNSDRETKLEQTIEKNQDIILQLTNKFDILEDIQKDVEYIKNNK